MVLLRNKSWLNNLGLNRSSISWSKMAFPSSLKDATSLSRSYRWTSKKSQVKKFLQFYTHLLSSWASNFFHFEIKSRRISSQKAFEIFRSMLIGNLNRFSLNLLSMNTGCVENGACKCFVRYYVKR